MLRQAVLAAIAAALAITSGALIAACGGGGDRLTLEEYFERFEALDAEVDQQIEALFADFPEDVSDEEFFSDEENLPLIKELFAGFPRVLGDGLGDLRELDPPAEVEDAHNEFLEAGDELRAAFERAASMVADVETVVDVPPINESAEAEIAPAEQRFDLACLDMVGVAERNGITVNVTCGDE